MIIPSIINQVHCYLHFLDLNSARLCGLGFIVCGREHDEVPQKREMHRLYKNR